MNQPSAYAIFHLNLAFSSIDTHAHKKVIENCYWPLLDLIEKGYPLGLELSTYTLECIEQQDSLWVDRFRLLLLAGKCELIASGDSQLIGPLVPYKVNCNNLELGLKYYQKRLGVKPSIAYINEQSVSSSLLDVYIDAGFDAIFMEWDNPRSLHPEWPQSHLNTPLWAKAHSGRKIKLLWNWSIGFQKIQRLAHKQLALDDYARFINELTEKGMKAFPLYGNDAEVFDYRPGRFSEEAETSNDSEWAVVKAAFDQFPMHLWELPSRVVDKHISNTEITLTTPESPVVVKKQRKYNLTRWAVSGRNDLMLNTFCHHQYQKTNGTNDFEKWQQLCRLWASDHRTHLTQNRYQQLQPMLEQFSQQNPPLILPLTSRVIHGEGVSVDKHRGRVKLEINGHELSLNMIRGGAIEALKFAQQNTPVVGTLHHGHYENIALGADFYTNHLVVEMIAERKRLTDLQEVDWSITHQSTSEIELTTQLESSWGTILKRYTLNANGSLRCIIQPPENRVEGVIRLAAMTLLNTSSDRPIIGCHHGGRQPEFHQLTQSVDHCEPGSTLVSASNALGATEGSLWIGAGSEGIQITWDPASCAAIPLLTNKLSSNQRLTRIHFSLCELDETLRAGGHLPPFEFVISPWTPKCNSHS